MKKENVKPTGKIVLGTVKGDLHDIGKHLVGILLEGAGWEVVDIGINVSPDQFIGAARENNPDVIGLSALLTTTMSEMETVIKAFKSAGMGTKFIVGGAPITKEFAQSIKADAFGANAWEAVVNANALL